MACAYEIIRQKKKNLHVYMHSGGQALDILIGAGCIKSVEIAYGANGRFAPTCVRFRKAAESGKIMVEDYTNYQMTLRFKAGAMGVPYLPVRSGMGTDIVNKWGFNEEMRQQDPRLPNQKLLIQNNPFAQGNNEPLVLVPAIHPDVTLLHVQQADTRGTVRISGLTFADVEQALASKHVIVTCEELLEPEKLQSQPERNQIPFFVVDAVVQLPFGAHPSACYEFYDYDNRHLKLYYRMAADDKAFSTYLEKYVFSISSHPEYLKKIGRRALDRIKATPPHGYAQGLNRK
jgi:glutaconate CoA-transferase subunit A